MLCIELHCHTHKNTATLHAQEHCYTHKKCPAPHQGTGRGGRCAPVRWDGITTGTLIPLRSPEVNRKWSHFRIGKTPIPPETEAGADPGGLRAHAPALHALPSRAVPTDLAFSVRCSRVHTRLHFRPAIKAEACQVAAQQVVTAFIGAVSRPAHQSTLSDDLRDP